MITPLKHRTVAISIPSLIAALALFHLSGVRMPMLGLLSADVLLAIALGLVSVFAFTTGLAIGGVSEFRADSGDRAVRR